MTTNTVQEGSLNDTDQASDSFDEQSGARRGVGALLQTCCPDCRTLFEVPPDLLVARDSRVRCGECLVIFDALVNLADDESTTPGQKAKTAQGDSDASKSSRQVATETRDTTEKTSIETGEVDETSDVSEAGQISKVGEISDVSEIGKVSEVGQTIEVSENDETQNVDVDDSILDLTYADSDLFSVDAGLPEVVYYDHTRESVSYGRDDPDTEEAFNESLFGHEMAAERGDTVERLTESARSSAPMKVVSDVGVQNPVDFKYRNSSESVGKGSIPGPPVTSQVIVGKEYSKRRRSSRSRRSSALDRWVIRSALVILAAAIALGLYGYRNFNDVAKDTALRPVLAVVCSLVGCELRPLVDLDGLKVLERSVFSHPTIDNALVIDLSFINEAEFDQPYPVLEIKLTDRTGAIVEQNRVTPAEYLDQWREEDLLPRDKRLDLSLTVDDPGQRASSFELNFR